MKAIGAKSLKLETRHFSIPMIVWNCIMPQTAKLLFGTIFYYTKQGKMGYCYFTNRQLAELLTVNRDTIKRNLYLLIDKGLVFREEDEQGRRRLYAHPDFVWN